MPPLVRVGAVVAASLLPCHVAYPSVWKCMYSMSSAIVRGVIDMYAETGMSPLLSCQDLQSRAVPGSVPCDADTT